MHLKQINNDNNNIRKHNYYQQYNYVAIWCTILVLLIDANMT